MKKNPVKLLLAACAGVFLLEKFKGEAEKKYDPAVNTSSSSEEEWKHFLSLTMATPGVTVQ